MAFGLIFWSSMIHMILGIPTLDFYLRSSEAPSIIRFECINNRGEPAPTARFEFYNGTRDLIAQRDTDASQTFLTYSITEDSIIRCIIGEEYSEEFMFAAIPTLSNQTVSIHAFCNTSAMLICPIPLPTVRSNYTIIWEQLVDSTPIPLMNDSELGRYILHQDNRTLSILVMDSTDERVFRCKLNLKQCSPSRPDRCLLFDVEGPFMEIKRSEMTVFPSSQIVTNGDTAIFHCNSNISVRWNFNGTFCGSNSCEQNGIYINRTQDRNLIINATLEIRTGELHSIIMETINYTIQCIAEQNHSSSLVMTRTLTVDPQQVTESDVGVITTFISSSDTNVSTVVANDRVTSSTTSTANENLSSSILAVIISVLVVVLLSGMLIGIILIIYWTKRKRIKKIRHCQITGEKVTEYKR